MGDSKEKNNYKDLLSDEQIRELSQFINLSDDRKPNGDKKSHLAHFDTDKPTIVIDSGHNYYYEKGHVKRDTGTKALLDGVEIKEAELALKYSLEAKKKFEAAGFNVIVVAGTEDTPLKSRFDARIKTAVENKAAVYLSFHFDNFSGYDGLHVFVPKDRPNSLSSDLQETLLTALEGTKIPYDEKRNLTTLTYVHTKKHKGAVHSPNTATCLIEWENFAKEDGLRQATDEGLMHQKLDKLVSAVSDFCTRKNIEFMGPKIEEITRAELPQVDSINLKKPSLQYDADALKDKIALIIKN